MIDECQKENFLKWKQWLNIHKNNHTQEEAKGDRFVGALISSWKYWSNHMSIHNHKVYYRTAVSHCKLIIHLPILCV